MKTIQEQIEVMQHYVNGGEVEYINELHNEWRIATTPTWDWISNDFRIKEQNNNIVIIEKWLISYEDNAYQILIGNEKFFKKHIHPQSKVKLLETYEVEL